MKKTLITMALAAGMAVSAGAQDEKKDTGAAIGGDEAGAAAEKAVKSKDLATLLKDQLIVADGEKTKAAKFDEGMEYYLVYHSASW